MLATCTSELGMTAALLTIIAAVGASASGSSQVACSKEAVDVAFNDELHLLQLDARFVRKAEEGAEPEENKIGSGVSIEQPKKGWRLREGARLNEVLVVPSLKLVFCFIPKNACTQFNRLMNALNGIGEQWDGDICSKRDPNYRSTMYGNFTARDLESALNDPTWTKATFLRDPLERMVSAYISKCVRPRECGSCMGLETSDSEDPEIAQLADTLEYTGDAHFLPQSSLCGGLGDNIGAYDFIGHISRDSQAVAKQVANMLELAVKKSSSDKSAQLSHEGELADARKSSGKSNSTASSKGILLPFGREISQEEARVLELGQKFFPASGPHSGDPHVHARTNASDYLLDNFALMNVMRQYDDDYNKLPGLRRPDWAYRVSKLYDAFGSLRQRPQWLSQAPSMAEKAPLQP